MAEEKNRNQEVQPQSDRVEAAQQEWFDPGGDFRPGERLKARQWETDHRLADDNSGLGNLHQGTGETDELSKSGTAADFQVADPEGIELPEPNYGSWSRVPPEDVAVPDQVAQHGVPEDSEVPVGPPAGAYQPPDFDALTIQGYQQASPEPVPEAEAAAAARQGGPERISSIDDGVSGQFEATAPAAEETPGGELPPADSEAAPEARTEPGANPAEATGAPESGEPGDLRENIAPSTGGDVRLKIVEDQAIVLEPSMFSFIDQDGDSLQAIRFTDSIRNGSLLLDGEPLEPGDSIAIADLSGGKVSFLPVEHGSGTALATVEYQVSDGSAWSSETARVTIDVASAADVPELAVEIGQSRLVPIPGTGTMVEKTIDINNFRETDGGFSVTGRIVDGEGNLSEASVDHLGTGSGGFAPKGSNAGPDYQLGVDMEHQVSEELIIRFDQPTAEATVIIDRLIANEAGKGGHESGRYLLKKDGENVEEGTFFTTSGSRVELELSPDNQVFDEIVFTATAGYEGGRERAGDASDYVVRSVNWRVEEGMDTVWRTDLSLKAELVDQDGSEKLGPILVEGVPPGAMLSAGELISGGRPADFQATSIGIKEQTSARIVFEGETAGYRNSLGYYQIDPETGQISEVKMLWENASLKGSGGSLIAGESSHLLDIDAGDQVGFFIVADGDRKNAYEDLGEGHFEFRSGTETATVSSQVPELIFVADDGTETRIKGHVYHTTEGEENFCLNPDGIKHTRGDLDLENGSMTLGFEDLKGGGDRDFDDSIFTVEIGRENTEVLASENAGFSTWRLDPEDLDGLTVTIPGEYREDFELTVSTVATENDGDSASAAVTLTVTMEEDGPRVEADTVPREPAEIVVDGVALESAATASGSADPDLEAFVADGSNDASGLPGELESFAAEDGTEVPEEVPALDEQAAEAEPEAAEQQESGLEEQAVTVEEMPDTGTGQEEIPQVA